MKIKNISLIERHIEKVFISIAILVLIASVWLFGINTPNAVEIGGEVLAPGEIDSSIDDRANALNQRIQSDTIPQELENLKIANYTESFFDRIDHELAEEIKMTAMGPLATFGLDENPGDKKKYVPIVPAPVIVAAQGDIGAISPIIVGGNATLAEQFSANGPFDTSWISLVGHFDLLEMRKELLTPNSEEYMQIDSNWWESQFAIISYEVQKQTAGPDGTFDDTISVVTDLPGQPRIELPDAVTLEQGPGYLQFAQDNQEALIRFPFYALKGRTWEAPKEIIQGLNLQRIQEVSGLYQAIIKKTKDITLLIKRRDSSPQNAEIIGPKIPLAIDELINLQRDFWLLTNSTVNLNSPVKEINLDYRTVFIEEKAEEIINQENARIDAIETLFAERLKLDPTATREPEAAPPPLQKLGPMTIPENGQADIWAHDLNVQPGKTYRYRMRIFVTNPLWEKKRNLPPEQIEAYASRFQLGSDWGEWSPSITISPTQYVFLDKAQTSPAPIPGNVEVDIWKYWDGNWRNNSFQINPGDPIGSFATTDGLNVNYYAGANLVDIDFKYRLSNRTTARIVYTQNGKTLHRIQSLDRDAPLRDYLKTQKELSLPYTPTEIED